MNLAKECKARAERLLSQYHKCEAIGISFCNKHGIVSPNIKKIRDAVAKEEGFTNWNDLIFNNKGKS